jgi:SAM-dependent methyltransferase
MKTIINKIGKFLSKAMRNVLAKRTKKINNYKLYSTYFKGKNGLEIGGPSDIFKKRGLVPVYKSLNNLDGCNFNTKTVWEGQLEEGPKRYLYYKGKSKGYQYIKDAVDLRGIDNEKYDFILSSHAIEHIANPFKAISEWLRVLKTSGLLLMVVPHKDGTFDHNRPVTQLQHLIDDFRQSISEDDISHLPEILELHDLALDPPAGDLVSFRQRSLKNYENRCLHHHVFDADLVARIIHYFKLQILDIQLALPFHIMVLAQKIPADGSPDNSEFLSKAAKDVFNILIPKG